MFKNHRCDYRYGYNGRWMGQLWNESEYVKQFYTRLWPTLLPHQEVAVVPGLFGDKNKAISAEEPVLLLKLAGYVAWAKAEPRITGMMPCTCTNTY
jgi:hypothetical protein